MFTVVVNYLTIEKAISAECAYIADAVRIFAEFKGAPDVYIMDNVTGEVLVCAQFGEITWNVFDFQ